MLAYAANRPVAAKRQSSPNALLIVVSVHVALLAAVMSAKMDLPRMIRNDPVDVFWVPKPPAPPPPSNTVEPSRPRPFEQLIDNPPQRLPVRPLEKMPTDFGQRTVDPGPI